MDSPSKRPSLSGRRRASLLDQMQQVAEEQAMQSFGDVSGGVLSGDGDDDDDDDDMDDDDEEAILYAARRVGVMDVAMVVDDDDDEDETDGLEEDGLNPLYNSDTIYEGEEDTTEDDDHGDIEGAGAAAAGVIPSLSALDPLYEDTEGEGTEEGSASLEDLVTSTPRGALAGAAATAAGATTATTTATTAPAPNTAAYYQYDQDTLGNPTDPNFGAPGGAQRRSGSFMATRRSVRSVENDSSSEHLSVSSLPNTMSSDTEVEAMLVGQSPRQRRLGGSGSEAMSRSASKRRSNFGYRQSVRATIVSGDMASSLDSLSNASDSPGGGGSSSGTSRRGRLMSRATFLTSRRPSRRSSNRSNNNPWANTPDGSSANSSGASGAMDIASAVDQFNKSVTMDNNNANNTTGANNHAWDQTIAAAAIVAASTNAPGTKRKTKQYSAGEHALVMLGLLNAQNRDDDPADFTICPVNEAGYPKGVGKTEEQKKPPFSYLICTVTVVHFDEDERYYTVRRGDTASEQRADPSVMTHISDEAGIHAAFKAAKRTRRHEAELSTRGGAPSAGGPLQRCVRSLKEWPVQFYKKNLVPFYRRARARTKVVSAHLLHGDHGYAFKMKLTGINFLVLCSFIYLFIDVFNLSFLSSSFDFASAVIGLVVWIVLLLELLFEGLIRPDNYHELIRSEKAYAPSTARNINAFHLVFESAALFLYFPQFPCIFDRDRCGDDTFFGGIYASLLAVTSPDWYASAFGRIILGLTFLRVFGLVRHWKQMWLLNVFENDSSNSQVVRRALLLGAGQKNRKHRRLRLSKKKKNDHDDDSVEDEKDLDKSSKGKKGSSEDQDLKNAANIGTALMIVNSHRVLVLLLVICVVFPAILSIMSGNYVNDEMVSLLNANNLVANNTDECDYLYTAVKSWLSAASQIHSHQRYLLGSESTEGLIWAQLMPAGNRCDWLREDGVITDCDYVDIGDAEACSLWNNSVGPDVASPSYFADTLGKRVGELQEYSKTATADFQTAGNTTTYYVESINDLSNTVTSTFRCLFLLQISMLMAVLFGLTVMRGDAGRLVLDPLQRMLKIVVRYAENPLSQSLSGKKKSNRDLSQRDVSAEQLGSYETDQLINAIAKIADLLRKCWGVAGADIISFNLARTKDGKINATVPGKRVYALFGFVAIREFDMLLRALEQDVMVLINDVARVVHDEVYRWALNDSGQCNKNLGAAFLMVFRIGDFSEVHDRQKRATAVVFDSNLKGGRTAKVKRRRGSGSGQTFRGSSRRPTMSKFGLGTNGTLQLASLPGIQQFTDRALLSLLKSYSGILRDEKILRWKKDFRLGAGVGAFSVEIIYGMDAGWAVEGAVGSMYKIDATYLSPHVNMASRMMSASKQYGVTILLSQAVEELLSKPAQAKLRHLDTVIVKGASRPQRIFTFDARSEGADFFLFDRTKEQADVDAETFTAAIWDTDQDLKAMRQHVSDEFMERFKRGVDLYISGEWKSAIEVLKEADNIMIETVIEEGYIESDVSDLGDEIFDAESEDEDIVRLRNQYGDGACKNLISYMERRDAIPPSDWSGFRALMSK